MGFMKRTKNFFQDKKSPVQQKPPPLPSPLETPTLQPITNAPEAQSLPRPSDTAAHYITAENIRELRELIRYKYALDIEIWKQRAVKEFARDHCKENMRRSDAALVTIQKTLQAWDRREYFTTEEEFQKFKVIKDRLMSGNKVIWQQTPPWEIVKRHSAPVRAPYEMNGGPPSVASPQWHGSQGYSHRPAPSQQQSYQRAVSDPQPAGQRAIPLSQQVPERRPIPQYHQRVVSAPQHIQRFGPPQSYQALPPQTTAPRYA